MTWFIGRRRANRASRIAPCVLLSTAIVSCGGAGGTDRFATTTTPALVEVATSTADIPSPSQVDPSVDLEEALDSIEKASSAVFSTGTFQHSCGEFALIQSSGYPLILTWVDEEWIPVEGASTSLEFDSGIDVLESWQTDLTGDGEPEVVLRLGIEGANRNFGQILSASPGECLWGYLTTVDGCSESEIVDDLAFEGSKAVGTGFVSCGDGRDSIELEWLPEFSLFVAMPFQNSEFCFGMREDLDLPLSNCSEGWPVSMAQEAIADQGISVDIDGRFGPGTQRAVLRYQQELGLPLTGQVDPLTWSVMYPAGSSSADGWTTYPDYDGDGISTPREIGHATGALEYYVESNPIQPSRRQKPTVVRTYCETRSSGLVSDMRGPLVDYVLVTEYSNGRKTFQTVGSSWANFPGRCG